jgi:hypothetical protein
MNAVEKLSRQQGQPQRRQGRKDLKVAQRLR